MDILWYIYVWTTQIYKDMKKQNHEVWIQQYSTPTMRWWRCIAGYLFFSFWLLRSYSWIDNKNMTKTGHILGKKNRYVYFSIAKNSIFRGVVFGEIQLVLRNTPLRSKIIWRYLLHIFNKNSTTHGTIYVISSYFFLFLWED